MPVDRGWIATQSMLVCLGREAAKQPKSGQDFWKTGPERDLGPDAPVFRETNFGKILDTFWQVSWKPWIMAPNGNAKKKCAPKTGSERHWNFVDPKTCLDLG